MGGSGRGADGEDGRGKEATSVGDRAGPQLPTWVALDKSAGARPRGLDSRLGSPGSFVGADGTCISSSRAFDS